MLGHRNARSLRAQPAKGSASDGKDGFISSRGEGAKVATKNFAGAFSDVDALTRGKRPERQFRAGS
jgi:hypothetical protein